ncbi:gamma-tubulin complex, DGRIP91/SPC98 component protein [Crucibulum laeve]|uniref:Spindle pole body component n=1 Tax=Crucibulum laeve TaxID=68775 RepID=A0A5C3MG71_9AGAR|nr:gamma-tubulin complex, DGRIP91/SPC98 component protein [Crucibulum laeve]
MWHYNLPELDDFEQKTSSNGLPPLGPRFFVPPLVDKPQNPIMDSLKLTASNKSLPPRPRLPLELLLIASDIERIPERVPKLANTLWTDAAARKVGFTNQTLSWDRLSPLHSSKASTTAFLSEQDTLVFAAARYHVQPRLQDPGSERVYVTQEELLFSLKMTVLGTSSTLHAWDSRTERFIQARTGDGKSGLLLVDGKDEVISTSIISRFTTIGALLRRLETFLGALRTKSAHEGPTVHAFAHSLSTLLTYLRDTLTRCPPSNESLAFEKPALSAIWMHYEIYEEILVALSSLYERGMDTLPQAYPKFDSSPIPLLSRVYSHLNNHLERRSPRIISAIFAFILTSASREYLQQVARSVGLGGQHQPKTTHVVGERHNQYDMDDEEDGEEEEDIFDALEKIEDNFPSFFPPELLDVLPAAQKSLILLRNAQPDHPLLRTSATTTAAIKWFWSTSDIEAVWSNADVALRDTETAPSLAASPPLSEITYKPELELFRIFDLEPGTYVGQPVLNVKDTSSLPVQAFINAFPETLPPITPTLSHLTSLVFYPLVQHASALSSTLLSLFLSSSGILNFRSHLILLRSYLLLTAPPFKSRLSSALFSDAEDYEIDTNPHEMSLRSLRRRSNKKVKESTQPWAIGISPSLLERETWPPVGGDLSFFLRTVIVDSFEKPDNGLDDGESEKDIVIEEAGWRLGFAIRDLPSGPGRDKWLNPLSIEALDFLYMDYKPPNTLEILISPDVLSKYQRMFAFTLRLLRVENALKSVFRVTRQIVKPLFPTLAASNKLLMHFRFIAQSFVTNLSEYVFDTAIGGNFDPFILRLRPNNSAENPTAPGFSDVFELASQHSALLDDILSACLLRSGQRGVGELLRQSLELVLEFCVIVAELHRGRLEEYQAAPMIEEIFQKFKKRMGTLMKVLKGLVEKGPSSDRWPVEVSSGRERRPTGGADALNQLLMRLDLTNWW